MNNNDRGYHIYTWYNAVVPYLVPNLDGNIRNVYSLIHRTNGPYITVQSGVPHTSTAHGDKHHAHKSVWNNREYEYRKGPYISGQSFWYLIRYCYSTTVQ